MIDLNCNSYPYENRRSSCQPPQPMQMQLAMAYVPWQRFGPLYEPDQALQVGTIFPELNKPFTGKGGMYHGQCMQ